MDEEKISAIVKEFMEAASQFLKPNPTQPVRDRFELAVQAAKEACELDESCVRAEFAKLGKGQ